MPKTTRKSIPERRIFVSYSHVDVADVRMLLKWLRPLCARLPGATEAWVDYEQLKGGDEWNSKIQLAVDSANVFIVMLSIDYVASKFCMSEELRRILTKREQGQAQVIGIALRQTPLENFTVELKNGVKASLADVQCLPQCDHTRDDEHRLGLRFIRSWPKGRQDEAWDLLARQLESALIGGPASVFPLTAQSEKAQPFLTLPANPPGLRLAAQWLPYLADRDDQCIALNTSLALWAPTGCRRPLVLLTEGRTEDCLSKWVDRLQNYELTKSLGLEAQQQSFGHYKSFAWPAAAGMQPSAESASRHFQRALANCIGPLPTASQQEMFDGYLCRQRPTLLWVSCQDRLDVIHAKRALEGLLLLLGQWPDLSPANMLVVAINLERGRKVTAGQRARLAEAFVQGFDLAAAEGSIHVAVLGSLPELDESHVTRWAQEHAATYLRDDVEMLCDDLPVSDTATWPMLIFAKHAREWITSQ